MSAAAAVLPYVWAVAQTDQEHLEPASILPEPRYRRPAHLLRREVAFYRKYTQALLHRYLRMSMEAGKVPSLLGQEMFRGRVTSYRVDGFDDVVIFLHDVDHCLEQLDPQQQRLVRRIALEQYTVGETAVALRLDPRTVIRKYAWALDRRAKLLEPQKCCQGV